MSQLGEGDRIFSPSFSPTSTVLLFPSYKRHLGYVQLGVVHVDIRERFEDKGISASFLSVSCFKRYMSKSSHGQKDDFYQELKRKLQL